jgi:tripartite-type tricarboxylate transporter receptor subunit TctC
LNISSISGSYNVDEVVTGGTSAKTGRVIDANTSQIRVTSTSGTFTETETLTGAESGATATLDSIRPVALLKYSGDVLYVEQRSPISRAADQIEDIKLIIKF